MARLHASKCAHFHCANLCSKLAKTKNNLDVAKTNDHHHHLVGMNSTKMRFTFEMSLYCLLHGLRAIRSNPILCINVSHVIAFSLEKRSVVVVVLFIYIRSVYILLTVLHCVQKHLVQMRLSRCSVLLSPVAVVVRLAKFINSICSA